MILEFAAFALIVALALFFFGFSKDGNHRIHFIIAGAFLLAALGVFLAIDNGLEVQSDCVNATYEVSHVWNCSNYTDNSCFGTPAPNACREYNETQCRGITNCTWTLQSGCIGTPGDSCEELQSTWGDEKCYETKGCYIWNESNPQTCDSYDTTYTYGPCYSGIMDYNYTLIIAAIMILVGIGTAAAALEWVKTAEV